MKTSFGAVSRYTICSLADLPGDVRFQYAFSINYSQVILKTARQVYQLTSSMEPIQQFYVSNLQPIKIKLTQFSGKNYLKQRGSRDL
jgi:hypothetical protein